MLVISLAVRRKLAHKHLVSSEEVRECFRNRQGGLLEDTREQHRTDPPTWWFIASTNAGRVLKVVFVRRSVGSEVELHLRTAYSPNDAEQRIYRRFGQRWPEQ